MLRSAIGGPMTSEIGRSMRRSAKLAARAAMVFATLLLPGAPHTAFAQAKHTATSHRGMAMLDPVGSFAPMLDEVIPAVVTILVTGETLEPVELKPRGADGRSPPLATPIRQPFRAGGS